MLRYQRTLQAAAHCSGIGLHSGRQVNMAMMPAPTDTGIVFVRRDLGGIEIEAIAANTSATSYATTLRKNGASVQTVEHLLSACAGLGITNARIELDADEVPIMDGSAAPFVRMIADAGIQSQDRLLPVLKITKPLFVRDGDKQLAVWPSETAGISYFIDFNHPLLKEQGLSYQATEENFIREVAAARTFGFLSDVQMLQANGLARGGSLENAVVLGPETVLNPEGLRYHDEFVRHKIMDLIGDLSLIGMPVIGHVVAHKSGHGLNAAMVSKLLQNPQNYAVLGIPEKTAARREAVYQQSII
ncbi:MAG: UDP-3-O-acyl-N-acetylglucosamine deacetylase [Nitrospirota bacterium]